MAKKITWYASWEKDGKQYYTTTDQMTKTQLKNHIERVIGGRVICIIDDSTTCDVAV